MEPVKLSIVIPVYNEKDTLETLLTRVEAVDYDKEIVLIDDCSTDGTREIAENYKNKNNGKYNIYKFIVNNFQFLNEHYVSSEQYVKFS